MPLKSTIVGLTAALLSTACAAGLEPIQDPPESVAVTTTWPWRSMIYVSRTERGVVAVGLGWIGAARRLRRALQRIGATPEDVVAVFLTHSHRDHMAGWRAVRHADFYLPAAEVPLFHGVEQHQGLVPRWVERINDSDRPEPGAVEVHPFLGDTAVAFGSDTVRAFAVPGHTPGSAAVLLDGVLFAGDAIAYTPLIGFHGAKRIYSEDVERSRESFAALWRRIGPLPIDYLCTAHGRCTVPDSAFVREVIGAPSGREGGGGPGPAGPGASPRQ